MPKNKKSKKLVISQGKYICAPSISLFLVVWYATVKQSVSLSKASVKRETQRLRKSLSLSIYLAIDKKGFRARCLR